MINEQIGIHTEKIQLDQLLKWANILSTGGQIKELLDRQAILVNGNICTEKRKKIYIGDVVELKGIGKLTIIKEEHEEV